MSQALLNIATRAAKEAAKILVEGWQNRNSIKVEAKSLNDYVSNVDKASEEAIIREIKRSRPNDIIVAEESAQEYSAEKFNKPGVATWIIDPLDGTRNFIMGNPWFSVSIAVQEDGETVAAIVYNPITEEMYTAVKGSRALLNDYPIQVGKSETGAQGKVVVTGFAYKTPELLERQLTLVPRLFQELEIADIRRTGAAALDLCYVASGKFDAYYEEGICPWDIAAGEFIVRQARGHVMDFDGGFNTLTNLEIIAGNNIKVCRDLLTLIRRTTRELAK